MLIQIIIGVITFNYTIKDATDTKQEQQFHNIRCTMISDSHLYNEVMVCPMPMFNQENGGRH